MTYQDTIKADLKRAMRASRFGNQLTAINLLSGCIDLCEQLGDLETLEVVRDAFKYITAK